MFGSSRAELYQDTAREAGDLEELTQKLSEDLRKYIVSLDFVPWLSREWFALAEPLRYTASIAGMENKLRKTKGDANQTLWESDQLACRYLLEEGKVNLVLRLLTDAKSKSIEDVDGTRTKAAVESLGVDAAIPQAIEQDLGVLLRCALEHAEATATLDLLEFSQHIAAVLTHMSMMDGERDYSGMQEVMVIHYVDTIAAFLEDLGEDRVMQLYSDSKILHLLVSVLATKHTTYDKDTVVAAARAINSIMDSEHFQTHPELHLLEDDQSVLVSLGEKFLDELCKDVKFRMSIRSLSDHVKRAKLMK